MSQRLIQHNSGRGSQSIQDIINRPWDVSSYICGLLSHVDKVHIMSLEIRQKTYIQDLCFRGRDK